MGLMTSVSRNTRGCCPWRKVCTLYTLVGAILGLSLLYLGQQSDGHISAGFQSIRALHSSADRSLHLKQQERGDLQPSANRPNIQPALANYNKTVHREADVVAENRNLDRGARQFKEMYSWIIEPIMESPGEGRVGIDRPPNEADLHRSDPGQQPNKRRVGIPLDQGFQRMQPITRPARIRPDGLEHPPDFVPRQGHGFDAGQDGGVPRMRRPGGLQPKRWGKPAHPPEEMPDSPIFLPPEMNTPGNIQWDYKVNANFSDTIPLNRNIPDVRPPECKSIKYDDQTLPNITVIIPFYNEVGSRGPDCFTPCPNVPESNQYRTNGVSIGSILVGFRQVASLLLRTVHAILLRTPPHLLHEIILVDDCSNIANLMEPLANYLSALDPKITLLRNSEREGLIRTRQRAADMATGDVLIFMDSHTEPGIGWAQPLLQFLRDSPHSVLQPGLVHIDKETFLYGRGGAEEANMGRTAFGWELAIRWMGPPPNVAKTLPYKVPTFLGCVLVIRRDWFAHLGGFDMAMDLWGGENMELGFRAWMCGGSAYTHPCSRVGHLFRPLPYSSENLDQGILRNNARVAEVWMEGYTHLFYGSVRRPVELTQGDKEAIAERRALKRRLNCTSFDVILKHVVPDMPVPPPNASYFGFIRPALDPTTASSCLDLKYSRVYLGVHNCPRHHIKPEKTFYLDSHRRLLHGNGSRCVLVNWQDQSLYVSSCETADGLQGEWRIEFDDNSKVNSPVRIVYSRGQHDYCLMRNMSQKTPMSRSYSISLGPCAPDTKKGQLWTFTYNFQAPHITPASKTRQNGHQGQHRIPPPRDMRDMSGIRRH